MNNFCVHCGTKLEGSASFCGSCGQEIEKVSNSGIDASSSVPKGESAMSDRIRTNLKGYKKHKTLTCLECGYNGLMGVTKETFSGTMFWVALGIFGFILGLMFGIVGFILGIGVGVVGGLISKAKVMCPNCNKELGPV